MMNSIACEWIFLVVESHEYDIERIDQIDSENRRHSSYFPSGYDSECRYHKSDEHGSRFSEQYEGFHAIQPSDENGRDEYGETEEHKSGIDLGRRSRIYEIQLERQDCHDEKRHERESRCKTRNPVRPIDGIEDHHIPHDREYKRYQIDLKIPEHDIVLIEIENSPEYIGYVSDFDTRDTYDRSDSDLHHEPYFCRNEKWGVSTHISEFLSRLLDIAFIFAIKFMDRIEIVYETDTGHYSTQHEDDE